MDTSLPLFADTDDEGNEDFNVTASISQVTPIQEVSLEDALPSEIQLEPVDPSTNQEVTCEVIPGATKQGRNRLVDDDGYTYVLRRVWPSGKIAWRCSVRSKSLSCNASIQQDGQTFRRGHQPHCHLGKPGIALTSKMYVDIKRKATDDVFKSASNIVENVIRENSAEVQSQPSCSQPQIASLVRQANRHRQKLRPEEPSDLDFVPNQSYIPENFLRADIKLKNARHLIFATNDQLELLRKAKTWYMDGTFKVVKDPFKQLFSIHAFLKGENGNIKQTPLVLVLMSRRKSKDYVAVLKAVMQLLGSNISIEQAVLDFEAAAWKGCRKVLTSNIQGCSFHLTQAIWRKVQNIGLATSYKNDPAVHNFIRSIMALPFLPAEHIAPAFEQLKKRATTPLADLVQYVEQTWIQGSVWSPDTWSVFNQPVRTNNDVEGWHRRLNNKASRSSLQFYLLLPLLYEESCLVSLQARLVKNNKLSRYQRKTFKNRQGRFFELWKRYSQGELTSAALLKAVGHLNGPHKS
eukprot:gene15371-biopygen12796